MANPLTPYPIDGTVYDFTNTVSAKNKVIIYNLKNGNFIEITTDSDGLFLIDLANFPNFSYTINDPGLIRAYKEGLLFQMGEELISFSGDSLTQDVQMSRESPKQVKSIDFLKIDYAEHDAVENAKRIIRVDDILRKYKPADDDDNSNPEYYGFTDRHGNWYIEKFDSTDGSHRYFKGTRNYVSNFDDRTNLEYDYFHNIF